jgi:hypothetical protein
MATYSAIATASLAAGKPLTPALATKFRDNPIALYENTVGAANFSVTTADTTSYVDVTGASYSMSANRTYRVSAAIRYKAGYAPAPIDAIIGIYFKLYATSLAATPGYCMFRHRYYDAAGASQMALISQAVDSGTMFAPSSIHSTSNNGVHHPAFMDAIVYSGSSASDLKLAIRAEINKPGGATAPLVATYSHWLVQEISGSI